MKLTNQFGENLDVTFQEGSKSDALVLLGHGLTGNKDRPLLVAMMEFLTSRGWPCLRISYSGNGESEGDFAAATISKEVGDLQSILAAFPERKIAYIGHSMGGAVGVTTAAQDSRIRVLVTLAGMVYTKNFVLREFGDLTPDHDVMWEEENCPLSQAFVDDLTKIESTLPSAAKLTQPWLLIHGDQDDVIPVLDSIDAHAAATCEKKLVTFPEALHSFSELEYEEMAVEIDDWLEKYL